MDFNTPTTKAEMFDVLSDIFVYYRINKVFYQGVVLENLELPRIELQMPSDSALLDRARFNVYSAHVKAKLDYTDKIKDKIIELESKLSSIEDAEKLTKTELEEKYRLAIKSLNEQSLNEQIEDSGLRYTKIYQLEKERAEQIALASARYEKEKKEVSAKIVNLNEELSNAEEIYAEINENEVQAEFMKLKEQEEDRFNEIFKYNNGLEEKELRYRNTIKQAQANLELKFLSIRSMNLSKDELIELGYYNDVIDCVCGYYNTLTAKAAYTDILNESRLMIYLDDYYQDIVFLYQTRALS